MRRSINPKFLVTSWPPPNENYGDFNRSRFAIWVRYMMKIHDVPNSAFTNRNQKYYIVHKTLYAVLNGERDLTRDTVKKIARILAKHTPRLYNSIKREAIANTKPYSKDVKDS